MESNKCYNPDQAVESKVMNFASALMIVSAGFLRDRLVDPYVLSGCLRALARLAPWLPLPPSLLAHRPGVKLVVRPGRLLAGAGLAGALITAGLWLARRRMM